MKAVSAFGVYTQFSLTYFKTSFASTHPFGKHNQPLNTFATPLST